MQALHVVVGEPIPRTVNLPGTNFDVVYGEIQKLLRCSMLEPVRSDDVIVWCDEAGLPKSLPLNRHVVTPIVLIDGQPLSGVVIMNDEEAARHKSHRLQPSPIYGDFVVTGRIAGQRVRPLTDAQRTAQLSLLTLPEGRPAVASDPKDRVAEMTRMANMLTTTAAMNSPEYGALAEPVIYILDEKFLPKHEEIIEKATRWRVPIGDPFMHWFFVERETLARFFDPFYPAGAAVCRGLMPANVDLIKQKRGYLRFVAAYGHLEVGFGSHPDAKPAKPTWNTQSIARGKRR